MTHEDDIFLDKAELLRIFNTTKHSIRQELDNEDIGFTMLTDKTLDLYLDAVESFTTPYLLAKRYGWDVYDPVSLAIIEIADELYRQKI